MTADQYVGWGLAIIGGGLLLINAWATHTDRKVARKTEHANLISELRAAGVIPEDVPAETVDRMRAVVQAEAWVMERTPLSDSISERRLRAALNDDEAVRQWLG